MGSLAGTGQPSGQIGLSTTGQSVAHIGQSVAQSAQNNSKPVSSVAQQSLGAPSLPQPSAGQSVGVPVNNFPTTSCQTTPATTLNTFYPISFSHPVYSGTTVVSQVENNYGLVATGVALDGELENESASGAGQGSIDNRIEQAMDLVKSHLMSAVRSEVEELRDKISKLED